MMLIRTVILMFFFACAASAQVSSGSIDVTIDSEQGSWEMNTKSGWRGDGRTAHVDLRAETTPGADENPQSALSVGFYLADIGVTNFVNEVDIVLILPGETGAYVTKGHGAGSIINLQSVTFSEGQLALIGDFAVELFFTDDFGVTLDEGRVRTVAGHFEATLAPE